MSRAPLYSPTTIVFVFVTDFDVDLDFLTRDYRSVIIQKCSVKMTLCSVRMN